MAIGKIGLNLKRKHHVGQPIFWGSRTPWPRLGQHPESPHSIAALFPFPPLSATQANTTAGNNEVKHIMKTNKQPAVKCEGKERSR